MAQKKIVQKKSKKVEYALTQGKQSNYEIQVTVTTAQMDKYKEKALKWFQKDMKEPGFRKWHVPLEMVQKRIEPMYMTASMLEYVVHDAIQAVLDEHQKTQFIWQPYDFSPEQILTEAKKWIYIITFKLDVYPQMEPKDDKRKKTKIEEVKVEITEEKKKEVLETIQRQYAEYHDAKKIDTDTIARVKIEFFDSENNSIHTKSSYIWEPEFKEMPDLKKKLTWKKLDDSITMAYDHDTLPHFLHFHPKDKTKQELSPKEITITIADIKKMEIPELTPDFIIKIFGADSGLTNKEELLAQIEKTLVQTQEREILQQHLDAYLWTISSSFDTVVPQTFIEEEYKWRIKELAKQLGWEKWLQNHLESMNEQKRKAYLEEMKKSTEKSLQKFLILRKVMEELQIQGVDYNNPLEAEILLYEHVTGKELPSQKYEEEVPAKKEKAPATKKKTTKPAKKKDPSDKK